MRVQSTTRSTQRTEKVAPLPTLFVVQGPDKGHTYKPSQYPAVLGRKSEQVPLTDNSISRRHAILRSENGGWIIEDDQSSNGTYVNGNRIDQPTTIKHGDRIRLGSTLMVFGEDNVRHRRSTRKHRGTKQRRQRTSANDTPPPVELLPDGDGFDSSILASASAGEESVILASPETSDAVHSWKIMYLLAESLGAFAEPEAFLEAMADIIFDHIAADRLFVMMRDDASGKWIPQVARYRARSVRHRSKSLSRRIVNHVMETRQGVLCTNAQTDTRFGGTNKDASIHQLGLTSVICVPILTHDEVAGVIHLDCNMALHTYTHQQLLLATAIGKLAGLAIENAKLIQSRMKQERLAAVGETVAHLSHDIRNILQGMRSGSDVIEMGIQNENMDRVSTGWQIVQRNLERTYRLATNMLTFSKEREPYIETALLNDIIGDVLPLVERQIGDKGAVLETDLGELPPIPLDMDGIHQVLTNIVINAIDAVAPDTGRIKIATRQDDSAKEVCIDIIDNGPGIAEEDRERIFDAFYSSKGHGGTGLGLAASRQIVHEIGGRIELKSSPTGTTFTIHLAM